MRLSVSTEPAFQRAARLESVQYERQRQRYGDVLDFFLMNPGMLPSVRIRIGVEGFPARLRRDLSPQSCSRLEALMPYRAKLIHARWSGESCWSPLAAAWALGSVLPPENATAYPTPGQVLLYAGELSEPELLIAYGPSRFASKVGVLAGNPVLTIEDRLPQLAELGSRILWCGPMELCIDFEELERDRRDRL
jgi:Protein of unknown function (DUF3830)